MDIACLNSLIDANENPSLPKTPNSIPSMILLAPLTQMLNYSLSQAQN
jgi:hypothetical protein